MHIQGSCHCRNITFALAWDPDPTEIPARACDCSFCTKHGGVWTSNPAGKLEITVADASLVSRYAFGTKTAEFHVCSRCGVVPLVTSLIDDRVHAVVNVNAFENVAPELLKRSTASLGSETGAVRLARRKRGWIGQVEYTAS